jgi:hypothetical protein
MCFAYMGQYTYLGDRAERSSRRDYVSKAEARFCLHLHHQIESDPVCFESSAGFERPSAQQGVMHRHRPYSTGRCYDSE